jgi:arsenate reductase (thioredoxin)
MSVFKGGHRGGRPRIGGPRQGDAPTPPPKPLGPSAPIQRTRKRVLFVCIGNSCRSQMAEGFARAYGGDILIAASAGLSPAAIVQPLTKQVLAERNVRIDDQFPKGMEIVAREKFDVIVNMSGQKLPLAPGARVRDWLVRDPIGEQEPAYKAVAEQIEALVMRLILELRSSTL